MSPLITALWATFAVFAVERATGTIHVDAVRPDLGALVGALAFFVAWAPFEETLRVLMFNGTRMAFRRTAVAVVLVCVVFGLAHASNDSPEAGLVGMLSRL